MASYVAASRHSVPASLRRQMLRQARELLEAGRSEAFLVERAAEMPDNGWRDLVQHVQAWEKARRRKSGSPGLSVVSAERCPEHPQYYRAGCVDCALAVPA
ncbi:hypothetical protein ACFY1V_31710 [Streptomyces sp. NPDC001255]|uniref:hypothetical protein n=1 Tax=Streptomyces sp. NPDC001255 TaxID=3364550 RepID=UPI00369D3E53